VTFFIYGLLLISLAYILGSGFSVIRARWERCVVYDLFFTFLGIYFWNIAGRTQWTTTRAVTFFPCTDILILVELRRCFKFVLMHRKLCAVIKPILFFAEYFSCFWVLESYQNENEKSLLIACISIVNRLPGQPCKACTQKKRACKKYASTPQVSEVMGMIQWQNWYSQLNRKLNKAPATP